MAVNDKSGVFFAPQFSVILLAGSGCDAMGSVSGVIDQSLAKRASPDMILSCCRELLKAPFRQGLFTLWMVRPLTGLRIRLLQGETEVMRRGPGDAVRRNASGFAAAGLEA